MKSRFVTISVSIIALLIVGAAGFLFFKKESPIKIEYTSVDTVIENADVLSLDNESHIYNPGYIIISNTKIIAIGQGKPPGNISAAKTIDAGGKVVMPGLVNTHSHAAMALLDGIGQHQQLQSWLATMSDYEAKLSSADIYLGTLLAEDKMIKSGTTVFNDMYFFPEQAAAAVKAAGMRVVVRIPSTYNNQLVVFDDQIVKQNQNNPLISFSVAPNPLLNYSTDQLKQFSDYALADNYLVHIHFEEDQNARSDALKKYNLTPLELITQAGFLRNKMVLAHSVDVTADEISQISRYPNIGISFNPISEYNLSTPLTPAPAMLDKNILVGFGTDGQPSSNLDIFAQMKFAASRYLNCIAGQKFCSDGKTISAEKIVRMATIDGAKILGLDDKIGSLEIGKQADIILLNIKPSGDIYSALVYNTSGEDVVDSIIGGKMIMENRSLLTISEQELLEKVQSIIARISLIKN